MSFDEPIGNDLPRFAIDRPNQLLWQGAKPVKVPPKVFKLLSYFCDRPGQLLERDELLDAVWPREIVQPEILKTYVRIIRSLLQDDPHRPRFIETRARFGYRFIGQLPDRFDVSRPSPTGLIGREEVLAALQAARAAATVGRRRMLFLVGETGIGKTRAIDEFVARASDGDPQICRIDCAPARYGRKSFSPARELVVSLVSCEQMPQDVPLVSSDTLMALVEFRARAQPLMLVIENLQWADAVTIEVLSRIAFGRSVLHLMVVVSYRYGLPSNSNCPALALMLDLIVHGVASELRLHALEQSDVKRLVLASSNVAIPRDAVKVIVRYSGGNPLIASALVERMVAEVREVGSSALTEMLSRHELEGEFLPRVVPEIIRHALELQLRELGPLARKVLECGSLSGYTFCAWGISKMLGLDQVEVEELCQAMCDSGQMLCEGARYVFPDGSVTPSFRFRIRLQARLLLAGQSHARRDFCQQRFMEAVESCWGDDALSVGRPMTWRREAVREWTQALHYSQLVVANAPCAAGRDALLHFQRDQSSRDHRPKQPRGGEKLFFVRPLSEFVG